MQINLSTKLPSPHKRNSSEGCFACIERFKSRHRKSTPRMTKWRIFKNLSHVKCSERLLIALITLFPGYLKVSPPAPLHWNVRWETLGTRLITTVKEVWIPGLNKHRFWWFYFSVYSLFFDWEDISNNSNSVKNNPLCVVFWTLFSLFGYPDETLSHVFDILLERRLFVVFLHWRALLGWTYVLKWC